MLPNAIRAGDHRGQGRRCLWDWPLHLLCWFFAVICPCSILLHKSMSIRPPPPPPAPAVPLWGGREQGTGTGIRGHCLGLNPGQQEAAGSCFCSPVICHPARAAAAGCGLPNEDREVVPAVHRCRFPISRGDIPKHYSLQSRHWTGLGHILMTAGPASVCLKSHCPRESQRELERSLMTVKPAGPSLGGGGGMLILDIPDV